LEKKGIIVTTFSSQIARLKTLIEIGKKMNRQVVFIGRSMRKYCTAAQRIRIVDFPKSIPFHARRPVVQNALEKIQREGPEKYLIVCTGHQGEPNAQLSRMSRGETSLNLNENWLTIFSCSVIPVESNIAQRKVLEKELSSKKVHILKDLHSSGHASGKDHEELFKLLNPKHIIPSHAGPEFGKQLIKIAEKLGYKEGETAHLMGDGKRFTVK